MIFRRYFTWFAAVAAALWIPAIIAEVWFDYEDGLKAIGAVQATEANTARRLIEDHLRGIEREVRDVANMPWRGGVLTEEDRRREFQRLLKVAPVIHEIHRFDAQGRETLYVSRVWRDRVGNAATRSPRAERLPGNTPSYGEVFFRDGLEPFVTLTLPESNARPAGSVRMLLDLKFVADYIASLRFGQGGIAYVTDGGGTIIAHPDPDLMLRRQSIRDTPQFRMLGEKSEKGEELRALYVWNPKGGRYMSTSTLGLTRWHVFVEQPAAEVLQPVRDAATRGVAIFAIAILLAFAASLWSARSLARPILEVKKGAERIAKGDLAARIDVHTGDEVQQLGEAFNHMAEQLQDYTTGLERKVSEKTGELQAALKLAHDAMRARALFVAAASHDLRQPLYAVAILADTMALEELPPHTASALAMQREAIGILQGLFDNVLDLSRFDAGDVRPNLRVNALRELLAPLVTEYQFLCKAKGVAWWSDIAHVSVRTDPELLQRMLGNLLSNALRYTRRGAVGLRASIAGSEVEITVWDTGPGIAHEDQVRVFEEFVQLENPDRNRDEGVGLGLSIVRRISNLLDAGVTLHSSPGQGTRITFRVPLDATAVQRRGPRAPEASGPVRLNGLRIWVVEDDIVVRKALAVQFEALGVSHVFATRRHELEEQYERDGAWPDAVMIDDMLGPHEPGVDIAHWLRGRMDAGRLIVVTGNATPERMQSLEGSGVRVLRKPVAAEELLAWLRGLAARSSPAGVHAG